MKNSFVIILETLQRAFKKPSYTDRSKKILSPKRNEYMNKITHIKNEYQNILSVWDNEIRKTHCKPMIKKYYHLRIIYLTQACNSCYKKISINDNAFEIWDKIQLYLIVEMGLINGGRKPKRNKK